MSKVILSSALMDAHGKMGNVVFRKHGDEIVMAHVPIFPDREPTPAQAEHRKLFKLAAAYGHAVLADPARKALYAPKAKEKGTTVFNLSLADFMHGPSIDTIDLSAYSGKTAETISIQAHDDVKLVGLEVRIPDTAGTVLEQGPAAANGDASTWDYRTTTDLPVGQHVVIEVTATDIPGHRVIKTEQK